MQIFSFPVLFVIIASHNVFTPHISKTHLFIDSFKILELKLNWCSKDQPKKKETPLRGGGWGRGGGNQLPLQGVKIY